MSLEQLPDDLPPGRLIVPDPAYADGDPATDPVMWVSDEPVARPWEWWLRMRALHPRTGLWPLVLGTLGGAPARPWHDGELDPIVVASGEAPDAGAVLAALWPGDEEDDKEEDEDHGDWPGLADPGQLGDSPDAVAREVVIAAFSDDSLVGLVPAVRGADAITACGWLGSVNHTHAGDIAAVLGSWEERFGVRLIGVGFDTITVSVAAPPRTREHALAVAAEHFAFCPDNIWQGYHETLERYAEALVGQDCWSFWWD